MRLRFLPNLSLSLLLTSVAGWAQKPELVVQTGHAKKVSGVAFTVDGHTLASISSDKTIKLWDVSNGTLLRTLKRSSEFGQSLTFSPNGRILASDGGDHSLDLWDVSTGTLLRTLSGYSVSSMAFNPDSKTLAGINATHTIELRDVATGTLLRTFKSSPVSSIAFSPDGNLLASGSTDGIIKLWNISKGTELRTLKGIVSPGQPQLSATVERMPEMFYSVFGEPRFWPATGGRNNLEHVTPAAGHEFAVVHLEVIPPPGMHHLSVKAPVLYDTVGRKYLSFYIIDLMLTRLAQHRKADIAFEVPQGTRLQSLKFENYSFDLSTQTLSVEPVKKLARDSENEAITSLAFSPNGKALASGGFLLTQLWDVSSGVELTAFEGNSGWVRSLTFSPGGNNLFTASESGATMVQWDVSNGTELAVIDVNAIVFRPDGRALAAAIKSVGIQLYDLLTRTDLGMLEHHSNEVSSVALSRDGTILASGGRGVKLWDLARGGALRSLKENQSTVVALSSDGTTIAGAGSDGLIKVWNVSTGALLRSLSENLSEKNSSAVISIAFSPDNKTLASVNSGSAVVLRDIWTGEKTRTIELANTEPISVAFSPDGQVLAIATGLEGEESVFGVELWRVTTGKRLRSLKGHSASVQSVTFSPDGSMIASGSWDGTVKLWSVATGRLLHSLKRMSSGAVAFSPDGRILASDDDNTVRLWDVISGRELRTLKGHIDSVSSIAFSSNGKYLLSGSSDSSVKVWEVNSGKELATLIALDQDDWVVVTPAGLFDGSPEGWKQILWRFNNNTFDHAPVEAFYNEFFHPGLLADIFAGKSPKAPSDISLKDRRQPQLRLTRPDAQANANLFARDVTLKIEVAELAADKDNKAGSGARDVRLFRNGSLVKVWGGDRLNGQSSVVLEARIPIVAGPNKFTAYAFNDDNIKSTDATLTVSGADSLGRKGTLHILAIGVSQYANREYNLDYTTDDATSFATQLKLGQERQTQYQSVEIRTLLNESATKANILAELKKLVAVVQPEDGVVVYFSGHGKASGNHFYLVPHDLGFAGSRDQLSDEGLQQILKHSISDQELEESFRGIDAGQMFMVIDACNSGQALENKDEPRRGPMNTRGLAQLAYEKGMYIMTASQNVEEAFVSQRLKHSYLTYALVEEGLKTKAADADHNGEVTLREWFDYASTRVPKLREETLQSKSLEEVTPALRAAARNQKSQTPRVFYRREPDAQPMIVARP